MGVFLAQFLPFYAPFSESGARRALDSVVAGLYVRLSEEDRDKVSKKMDSKSIVNQKNMLLEYCVERGWQVYDIYNDDDYSGADRDRPEFNRLIDDARAGRINTVICKTQSRFTRELELVEKYLHGLFPVWGVRFIGVVDNADTNNKGNKKSRQINGLVNEWYLEDMSESIRSVLDYKRANGEHIGSFVTYGYKKDPDKKGHLIIDEEAAVVVREIFAMFSQGFGKSAIARSLNDRGIPNPTKYKAEHGIKYKQPPGKHSSLWKYFSVDNVLRNEMYIGNMVQGKYGSLSYKNKTSVPRPKDQWIIVEGTHEPIIDRELWDRVQTMLELRARPFLSGNVGIFARKVYCANCGYIMRSSKNRGKHYLQCANRFISKGSCIGAFISVDKLEGIILSELRRLSDEYLDMDELELKAELKNNLSEEKERILSNISSFQRKMNEYSKAIQSLYLDKARSVITECDFIQMSKEFCAERDRLNAAISISQKQVQEIDEKIEAGETKRDIIERYTNLQSLSREVVVELIDHIEVGRREKYEKDPPVKIFWNF